MQVSSFTMDTRLEPSQQLYGLKSKTLAHTHHWSIGYLLAMTLSYGYLCPKCIEDYRFHRLQVVGHLSSISTRTLLGDGPYKLQLSFINY
jgi:hypothetical protein